LRAVPVRDPGDPRDVFHPCLIAAAEIAVDAVAEMVAGHVARRLVQSRSANSGSMISGFVPT
jgi:hypothetical protein